MPTYPKLDESTDAFAATIELSEKAKGKQEEKERLDLIANGHLAVMRRIAEDEPWMAIGAATTIRSVRDAEQLRTGSDDQSRELTETVADRKERLKREEDAKLAGYLLNLLGIGEEEQASLSETLLERLGPKYLNKPMIGTIDGAKLSIIAREDAMIINGKRYDVNDGRLSSGKGTTRRLEMMLFMLDNAGVEFTNFDLKCAGFQSRHLGSRGWNNHWGVARNHWRRELQLGAEHTGARLELLRQPGSKQSYAFLSRPIRILGDTTNPSEAEQHHPNSPFDALMIRAMETIPSDTGSLLILQALRELSPGNGPTDIDVQAIYDHMFKDEANDHTAQMRVSKIKQSLSLLGIMLPDGVMTPTTGQEGGDGHTLNFGKLSDDPQLHGGARKLPVLIPAHRERSIFENSAAKFDSEKVEISLNGLGNTLSKKPLEAAHVRTLLALLAADGPISIKDMPERTDITEIEKLLTILDTDFEKVVDMTPKDGEVYVSLDETTKTFVRMAVSPGAEAQLREKYFTDELEEDLSYERNERFSVIALELIEKHTIDKEGLRRLAREGRIGSDDNPVTFDEACVWLDEMAIREHLHKVGSSWNAREDRIHVLK